MKNREIGNTDLQKGLKESLIDRQTARQTDRQRQTDRKKERKRQQLAEVIYLSEKTTVYSLN